VADVAVVFCSDASGAPNEKPPFGAAADALASDCVLFFVSGALPNESREFDFPPIVSFFVLSPPPLIDEPVALIKLLVEVAIEPKENPAAEVEASDDGSFLLTLASALKAFSDVVVIKFEDGAFDVDLLPKEKLVPPPPLLLLSLLLNEKAAGAFKAEASAVLPPLLADVGAPKFKVEVVPPPPLADGAGLRYHQN